MISRAGVINGLLRLFPRDSRYLEIGVNRGETFFAVDSRNKVAVDPTFLFPVDDARKKHPGSEFYQITSDAYFATIVQPSEVFHIIYLDGLHTFEQTLRDFTNAIHFLAPNGVVVVDDVVPNSYQASLPDQRVAFKVKEFVQSSDNSWMGDTYKLAFFLESFFPTYKMRTTSDNHGQAVVWRRPRASGAFKTFTAQEIAHLQFSQVIEQDEIFHKMAFSEIFDEISRERRTAAQGAEKGR
jgi:Methyltransferase domain